MYQRVVDKGNTAYGDMINKYISNAADAHEHIGRVYIAQH